MSNLLKRVLLHTLNTRRPEGNSKTTPQMTRFRVVQQAKIMATVKIDVEKINRIITPRRKTSITYAW